MRDTHLSEYSFSTGQLSFQPASFRAGSLAWGEKRLWKRDWESETDFCLVAGRGEVVLPSQEETGQDRSPACAAGDPRVQRVSAAIRTRPDTRPHPRNCRGGALRAARNAGRVRTRQHRGEGTRLKPNGGKEHTQAKGGGSRLPPMRGKGRSQAELRLPRFQQPWEPRPPLQVSRSGGAGLECYCATH